MEKIKEEYIKTNRENQYLKCKLYYSLGGMNYFTYKNEPRGYYVSVSPVERTTDYGFAMESYVAFSGYKKCVVTCARKGKKAEAQALDAYENAKKEMMARFSELLENAA